MGMIKMATSTPTQTTPDFDSMSPEELSALIAAANQARAERELAELAERRKAALAGIKGNLVEISAALKRAGEEGVEKGEFAVLAGALNDVITLAQAARKAAAEAGRAAGVRVTARPAGNGGSQRSSDLRDEILSVMQAAPDVEWTASKLVPELSPSPTAGTPRSSGLVGNHLTSMAEHGQIEQTSNSPKRYRAIPATS